MSNFWKSARRWLPGFIISLVFILILAFTVDWGGVAAAFLSVEWPFLVLHGLLYFASVGSRAMASRTLLEDRPTFGQSFMAMMQGYLLNNVLPFRLGELGRAYLLGRKIKQGMFYVLPAIVIERAYDLAFAAILVIGTLPFVLTGAGWARPAAFTTLGVVLAGLFSLYFAARFRVPLRAWLERIAGRVKFIQIYILPRVDEFFNGLAILTSLKRFLLSLLWMTLSWIFIAGCQFALLRGFMAEARPLYSTFTLGLSSFGAAIPSAPSGVGVFEGAVVAALAFFGISSGLALAYAVTHHVAHLVYSGVIGMIGFAREGEGLMSVYDKLSRPKHESQETDP
jgi:hypothetical protein